MEPDKTKPEGLGGLAQRLDRMEVNNDKMEKDMKGLGWKAVRGAAEDTAARIVLDIIEAIIDGK